MSETNSTEHNIPLVGARVQEMGNASSFSQLKIFRPTASVSRVLGGAKTIDNILFNSIMQK